LDFLFRRAMMPRPEGRAMNIVEATRSYESWLRARTDIHEPDLKRKHALMRESAFGFLRATYYRWAMLWPKFCPELAATPRTLAVGDLHIENFGTWRDGEARLIWGINDFDEAHKLAYANDLVRLAASALVARHQKSLAIDGREACAAILDGYTKQMQANDPSPFVLEQEHGHLRALALRDRGKPAKFWKKLATAKDAEPPHKAHKLLDAHLPRGVGDVRYARRVAGAGSLGLQRFVASGCCDGDDVAREAKARVPSALAWAGIGKSHHADLPAILREAVRTPDPFFWVRRDWILRRIAPHCDQIELTELSGSRVLARVLRAMGEETANIHRRRVKAIAKDLGRRDASWLFAHASRMTEATLDDWNVWKTRG
jgi:hypothetical protein